MTDYARELDNLKEKCRDCKTLKQAIAICKTTTRFCRAEKIRVRGTADYEAFLEFAHVAIVLADHLLYRMEDLGDD